MPATYHLCWVPREGNAAADYEDAAAADPGRGCFALADGASASTFTAEWAGALVSDFVSAAAAGADRLGRPASGPARILARRS